MSAPRRTTRQIVDAIATDVGASLDDLVAALTRFQPLMSDYITVLSLDVMRRPAKRLSPSSELGLRAPPYTSVSGSTVLNDSMNFRPTKLFDIFVIRFI